MASIYPHPLGHGRPRSKELEPRNPCRGLPKPKGPDGNALDSMLVEGKIDAVIEPNILPSINRRDPRVRRLFIDYKTEEQNYFKVTGIFPISQCGVVDPGFCRQILGGAGGAAQGIPRARDVAFDRIYGTDPEIVTISWVAAMIDEQRAMMGRPLLGLQCHRQHAVARSDDVVRHQFGVTPAKLDYKSFLDPTAALAGV